jgi:ABC-type uncharacterized transport system involved in gliding motility auxiliary subunit
MADRQPRKIAYASLLVLAIGFVAAVMASNTLLRGMRLDLTENELYTLSDGTRELLAGIQEPINLYYFFSDRESSDIQYLRSYAIRVREILEEFVDRAAGNLRLSIIDPLPFSEDEDRAAQYGLTNLNLAGLGDSLYFGLAATNTIGDEAIVELFDPEQEAALEYDLARLIYTLATPEKAVIGLIESVNMTGGFDPQSQQPMPPWIIDQQVRQLFEVRNLAAGPQRIDDDINLLWLVHPVDLDEPTLYAIDQFLMRGGRLFVFVDPLAEVVTAATGPTGAGAATTSDLAPLFEAWGIQYDPSQVVADNRLALSVNTGTSRRPLRHIGLIGLEGDAIVPADLITNNLASINVGTAGSLSLAPGVSLSLSPLLQSSDESATMPAAQFEFLADPAALLDSFVADGERHVLAARVSGAMATAFPEGPPEGADSEQPQIMTNENAALVLVADVDILSDRLWVQRQRSLLGQQLLTAFANNADFVTNALGVLGGSEELIGLESRATFARPFDRVEALRRDADARFRATEQQLQAELAETERRLGELQDARDDTNSLLMSPAQQEEIQRFRDQQLSIRQELRSVQRELDSSIERLGTNLQLINIIVVPLALALFALLIHWIRRRTVRR